jgi:hypothetical protein
MCKAHWSRVPPELQAEVYRTVKLRGDRTDATWAPWWRAQARATAHVAFLEEPNVQRRDAYLSRELRFAETLEARVAK